MDARATRRGVPAVVIWGGFGALAWAALTVLTGGSAAHADDQADGPLDGLTSVVSNTVSAVTTPVAPIVTQVVAPIVTTVVAPVPDKAPAVIDTVTQTVAKVPVVGPVVAPVVTTVKNTAPAVVTPVTDILTNSPVAQITDPVLDVVSGLPIVGDVVTDLGVTDVIDVVVGVVDDTTGLIGGVTDEVLPPVLEALDPTLPGITDGPSRSDEPDTARPATPAALISATASAASVHNADTVLTSVAQLAATGPLASDALGSPNESPATPLGNAPPGVPVIPSSSAGSGGGSPSPSAHISDDAATALCAWELVSGASDDALPASATSDTDVSPD